MNEIIHFGEHLMIDGYGGHEDLLDNKELVLECLEKLPELLGMRKLAKPEIYRAEDNKLKDPGGWSGFVIIAESHISIHTFSLRGFVSIDVYTCKNGMNTEFVTSYFINKFVLKDVEVNFVRRGTRYPKENINL